MSKTFNPRFVEGDLVRVVQDVEDEECSVKAGDHLVVKFLAFSEEVGPRTYGLRPLGFEKFIKVSEDLLVYVGRSYGLSMPQYGQLVTGKVSRISPDCNQPAMALLMVENVRGIYDIRAETSADYAALQMTRPGDKVEFVVAGEGSPCKTTKFKNLSLTND